MLVTGHWSWVGNTFPLLWSCLRFLKLPCSALGWNQDLSKFFLVETQTLTPQDGLTLRVIHLIQINDLNVGLRHPRWMPLPPGCRVCVCLLKLLVCIKRYSLGQRERQTDRQPSHPRITAWWLGQLGCEGLRFGSLVWIRQSRELNLGLLHTRWVHSLLTHSGVGCVSGFDQICHTEPEKPFPVEVLLNLVCSQVKFQFWQIGLFRQKPVLLKNSQLGLLVTIPERQTYRYQTQLGLRSNHCW